MYLVDTSVWINFLRANPTPEVELLKNLLLHNQPTGLTSLIFQELLQGSNSVEKFVQFRDYFGSQRFYHPIDNITSYESAAKIYFKCRKKGITIRSTVDCLIAQICIDHNLTLLHCDRDFNKIAEIEPKLKILQSVV